MTSLSSKLKKFGTQKITEDFLMSVQQQAKEGMGVPSVVGMDFNMKMKTVTKS